MNIDKVVEDKNLTIVVFGSYSCEFSKYLSVFNTENPDVTIDFIEYQHEANHNHDGNNAQQEYDQFILTTCDKLKSGVLQADLILYDSFFAEEYLQKEILADMARYNSINQFINNPNLLDGIARQCYLDGKIIGIPLNILFAGCIVDEELFAKIGASIPQYTWDYDDFYDIALMLNEYNKTAETKGYLLASSREADQYANLRRGLHQGEESMSIINTPALVDYIKKAKAIEDMGLYLYPDHFEQQENSIFRDDVLLYDIVYSDLHYYDAETYINQTWMRFSIQNSIPLHLSREAWMWLDTVKLPTGNTDSFDFAEWSEGIQTELASFIK